VTLPHHLGESQAMILGATWQSLLFWLKREIDINVESLSRMCSVIHIDRIIAYSALQACEAVIPWAETLFSAICELKNG
jgi:hypothetical protein